ncbi:MAG: hypothetical protein H6746_05075 [Deltaproteobacteria bacterium]|nr:hypothetical protein [Deltaproteobacteria bacterium]
MRSIGFLLAPALATALTFGATTAIARCPRQSASTPEPAPGAFDCRAAASRLGRPAAELASCQELLPGFWRVTLLLPGAAAVETHRFIYSGGAVTELRGGADLAAWLERSGVADAAWIDRLAMSELLRAARALPPGFTAEALASGLDPSTGAGASVRTRPLAVTLYAPGPEASTRRAVLRRTGPGRFLWTVDIRGSGDARWRPAGRFPLGALPAAAGSAAE